MSQTLVPTRAVHTRTSWRARAAAVLAAALTLGALTMAPASAAVGNDGTFTFTTSGGNATITGLATGVPVPSGLVIPAAVTDDIGTYPVTALGASAFRDKNVSSVTLPSTLVTIGNRALQNAGISEIVIPDGVQSFGIYALADNHLTSLTLPDSVTTLGSSTFVNNEIADLTLSNSLTQIAGFSNNKLSSVTIPDSVTSISASAFADNEIASIEWGSSLTSLSGSAFRNNLLEHVTIPSTVITVASHAFGQNPLRSVRIDASNASFQARAFWRLESQGGEQGFETVTFTAGPPSAITNANASGTVNSSTTFPSFVTASSEANNATTVSTPTIVYPASQDAEVIGATGFTSPTWKGYASEPASEVVATVPVTPAAPTLTLTDNTDITASWAAPADGGSPITGYTITLTPASGDPQIRAVAAGDTATTFEDLTPGSYTGTVVATNAVGDSDPSPASAPKVVPTVPATPTAPTAAVNDKTVTVSWTAPEDRGSAITGYTVTLTPAVGDPQTKTVGTGTSTSFTGLAPGTYSARVVATNALGDSATSPASNSVEVVATAPAAPAKPTATVDLNDVTVTWAAPDNGGSPITGYTITLTPAEGTPLTETVSGTTLTTEFASVPGGTWTATVVATNAVSDSAASPASDLIAVPTTPASPGKPGIALDGKDITVTWVTPNNGGLPITGYEITLTPAGGGAPLIESAGSGATAVTFTSVPAGSWTATVVAANDLGDSAASAESDSVTIEADPDPVVGTSVTATVGKVVYGQSGKVTVTVTAASGGVKPSGTVSTKVGSRTITAALSNGSATLTLPVKSLKPGTRSLTVTYSGAGNQFTGSSSTVSVKVVKASPKVKVKGPKKVKRGKTAKFTITVTAPGVKPGGKVTVKVAGKSKTVKLNAKGKAVVKVKIAKKTKPGKKTVTVSYKGDAYVSTGKTTIKTKITK